MSTNTDIRLQIEGMSCSSCALGVTNVLKKSGGEAVHVEFATGEASFVIDDKNKLPAIINQINDLGYKVVDSAANADSGSKLSKVEWLFFISLPFTLVLFLGHMFFAHHSVLNNPLLQLLLCLPVFIIGVFQFGKSAWASLKTGVPNMDVLIFIGSSAAFIYSIFGMLWYKQINELHHYMFFETTASIITLVLLGNVLEHRSVKKTTTAISELSALQVLKVKVLGLSMGKEITTEMDYKDIVQGMILQVNTGDKVPVDGEIIQGEASINESMITGESIPADKTTGNKVISGTIVLQGNFKMRAEQVGDKTTLSKIIELVKKAQQSKPEIQKLGDKISAVFVPVVVSISVLTFVINYFFVDFSLEQNALQESMMRSIAVLVISCPCAMGLATPTAVMVGIGRAAKMGILIKGGNTLEKFAAIQTIVFDKTGTLTTGNFKIKKLTCFEGVNEEEVKQVLYVLEQHSSHPIAKSIVSELKDTNLTLSFENIKEEKGLGISAIDSQHNKYSIGSYKIAQHLTSSDNHNVYVIKNNQLIAVLDLQDDIKNNALKTIESLQQQGITPVLLSGDKISKCQEVAQQLNIKQIYGEMLPAQKLATIEQLNAGGITAMVGDGINDAPALEKAAVGISIGNATQVAIQSAQIVLLKNNDLSVLSDAYLISKHTLVTIKQNLFWAFFYNVIAIPVAAAGFLSPAIAALSMAFSDIIVIGNSLRLKSKKLR